MKSSAALRWPWFSQSRIVGLLRDRSGLAAVEFAMILPVMLVTLFGMIGVTSAISIDRKITLISRTLSDLTSQGVSVSDSQIDNFFKIGEFMLTPYDYRTNAFTGGPLQQTISQLYVDPATAVVRVQWSKGTTPRAVSSVVDMPTDLIGKDANQKPLKDQYFILSEVRYRYAPSILPGIASVNLAEATYTRPRATLPACVLYNAASTCPKY